MNREPIRILFDLLRSAIRGDKLTDAERSACTPDFLCELLALAKKHDVAHLLAFALKENGLGAENETSLEKHVFNAVYRYRQLDYDLQRLCKTLEKVKIPFMPLKGSVLRKCYPKPWMRTSCDIDVLVRREDLEAAASALVSENGYIQGKMGSHDLPFDTPSKMHVELHYDLIEEGIANESAEILRSAWDTALKKDGFEFFYEMPDEMFYFYHISHMAKHFENGGCGIRPFIDLWILDAMADADTDKRVAKLDRGGLLKFRNAAVKLSRVWFENEEHDRVSSQMESFILRGGVYGNTENRVTVQQQKKGGRFKYALSRIFLSYDELKFQYPVLHKHRWLTPFMQTCRWFKLIFCGGAARSVNELKQNQIISAKEAEKTKQFLSDIGL